MNQLRQRLVNLRLKPTNENEALSTEPTQTNCNKIVGISETVIT